MAIFFTVDIHLPKNQKVEKVANAPYQIVQIKDERFPYPPDATVSNSDKPFYTTHYKPTTDRLEQMAENDTVKVKNEEKLKKDRLVDVHLPAKFKTHRRAFLELLEEFKSMWDEHLGHIHVSKRCIDLLTDKVKLVYSAHCQAGPTASKFAVAEVNRIIAEKVIKPVTIKSAAPNMLALK